MKKTKTAQTVLGEKDYQEFEKKAKKKGYSVSSLLRYLIKKFLKL